MSMDNPDVSQLRQERTSHPERCTACNAIINPHTAECRCS